jgi:hypothetical protein
MVLAVSSRLLIAVARVRFKGNVDGVGSEGFVGETLGKETTWKTQG